MASVTSTIHQATCEHPESDLGDVANNPGGPGALVLERQREGLEPQDRLLCTEILCVPEDNPRLYLQLSNMRAKALDVLAKRKQYHAELPASTLLPMLRTRSWPSRGCGNVRPAMRSNL
jgi:hypothetical protein